MFSSSSNYIFKKTVEMIYHTYQNFIVRKQRIAKHHHWNFRTYTGILIYMTISLLPFCIKRRLWHHHTTQSSSLKMLKINSQNRWAMTNIWNIHWLFLVFYPNFVHHLFSLLCSIKPSNSFSLFSLANLLPFPISSTSILPL